ncbi:MAG: hypothetical protein HUU37_09505 [Bdellovibrionales bacterium]|nr:hypothetical protein [Bdellovibrionales bacterium]
MRRIILLLLALAIPSLARANEVDTAKKQLDIVIANLEFVKKEGLHLMDEGRLYILQDAALKVSKFIQDRGLANTVTMNAYQQLIVKFRFSTQFFEFVRTKKTEAKIGETLDIVAKIRQERGFDDEPYTKILKSNLNQIKESLDQIAQASRTPDETRRRIRALTLDFGRAIAVADQGDRPKAFEQAIALHYKLKDLYGALQALVGDQNTFRFVLEVLGLNEFVAEYAQLEREVR